MTKLTELEHLEKAVVDADAADAARAIDLANFAAALDAAVIDSLFAAAKDQDK